MASSAHWRFLVEDDVETAARDHHDPCRAGEQVRWEQHPDLDELIRGHARGDQIGGDPVGTQCRLPVDAIGVPEHPDIALGRPGGEDDPGRDLIGTHRPLIAPDLELEIGDVVVDPDDSSQPIHELERARLVAGVVVPDHPGQTGLDVETVGAGGRGASQPGASTGLVSGRLVADRHELEALPATERDVAVCPGERAVEVVGEMLGDEQRAIVLDLDDDVGAGDVIRLGQGGQGRGQQECGDGEEPDQPSQGQNSTLGASSASSPASKNSRAEKPNIEATKLLGTCWTLLL